MQVFERWGRMVGAGAMVAALTACVAYPQGGYNQAGYPVGGQPTTSYPVTTYPATGYPSTGYPVQNGNNAWGNQGYQGNQAYQVQQGRILNIETVRVQDSSGIGAGGAIAGGLLGGVVGNQVGKGSGKTLATIAGVVGGALAGNAVQNNMGGGSVRDIYRVSVQLQDGSVRAFDYQQPPQFNIGEYVRIDGNQIYR